MGLDVESKDTLLAFIAAAKTMLDEVVDRATSSLDAIIEKRITQAKTEIGTFAEAAIKAAIEKGMAEFQQAFKQDSADVQAKAEAIASSLDGWTVQLNKPRLSNVGQIPPSKDS